jgi:hypothetical protein
MTTATKTLRLDSKGRVSLGEVTKQLQLQGLSGFTVSFDPNTPTRIILDAVVELPASEAAERAAVTNISLRDARRLMEILDDTTPPNDNLVAAAARFAAWERRD